MYRPVLAFGCESWVLQKRQKSKIQALEMTKNNGANKRRKNKNVKIREDLKIKFTLECINKKHLS